MTTPEYRTLRCANAGLYICAALMVLGAAVYVLCCKDVLWQQIAAIAAALITPVWAAHYALLRFTITHTGITRHSLFGSTTMNWADISCAEIREICTQGTASCTIHLQTNSKTLRISSDLFPLDDVQELAAELQRCGIIPPTSLS